MGSSSKVILVGATSLIVGVYAISLKKAEADGIGAAMKNVKRFQQERMEDAAVRSALSEFVKAGGTVDKNGTFTALDGTTFTYKITGAKGASPTVTLTLLDEGVSKVIVARFSKKTGEMNQGARSIHRGPWEIDKIYIPHVKKTKE